MAKTFGIDGKLTHDRPLGGGQGGTGEVASELEQQKSELKSILRGLGEDALGDFWESEDEARFTKEESDAYVDRLGSKMMVKYLLDKARGLADVTEAQDGDDHEGVGLAQGEGDAEEDKDGKPDEDAEGDKDGDDEDKDEHGEGEGKAPPKEGEGPHKEPDLEDPSDLEERVTVLEQWRVKKVDPELKKRLEELEKKVEEPKLPPAPKAPDGTELGWLPDEKLFGLLFDGEKPEGLPEEHPDGEIILPEWYDRALKVVSAGLPLFLAGPSGCGKSTVPQAMARELGRPYGAHSCSEGMHDGDLKGLLLPVEAGGNFVHVPSLFISMCTKPGIFLWDELDAADANFLVAFNMMLAQRELFIPTRRLATMPEMEVHDILKYWNAVYGAEKCMAKIGREKIKSLTDLREMLGKEKYAKLDESFTKIKLHRQFTIIAAANTFGHGADRVYAGRNQLDGATLDRFRMGFFNLDYSEKVERKLLSKEAFAWGQYMRKALKELRMVKRLVTTRFLRDCTTMQKVADWTQSDWAEQYFADWPVDEAAQVRDRVKSLIVADLQKKGM